MQRILFVLLLAFLRAASSTALDCIAAETGADILNIVRSQQGHAVICLTGDPSECVPTLIKRDRTNNQS